MLYKAKVCLPSSLISFSGLIFSKALESKFPANLPNVISNFDLIFILTSDSGIEEYSVSAKELNSFAKSLKFYLSALEINKIKRCNLSSTGRIFIFSFNK